MCGAVDYNGGVEPQSTANLMPLLARRTKPQLPIEQQYEARCKVILNTRLWNLSRSSAWAVLCSTIVLAVFAHRTISIWIFFAIPLYTIMLCFTGIVPLVILRRREMQAFDTWEPSWKLEIKKQWNSPRAWKLIGTNAGCAAFFALLHALCAASLGAHDWHLFQPTRRHAFHLNENMIFLILGNTLVGIALALRDIKDLRWAVKWTPSLGTHPLAFMDLSNQRFQLGGPWLVSSTVTICYSFNYWLLRKFFWRLLLRLPLLGYFFRPFIIEFARPSHKLHIVWYLMPRLLTLSLITSMHFEQVQACFDAVCGLGMMMSKESSDPTQCIFSGLQNPSGYYQHLAYLEFSEVARKGPASRRAPVFTDNGTPTLWATLLRQTLLILGEDYGRLKRRGNAPPPPPPPAPKVEAQSTPVRFTPQITTIHANALREIPQTATTSIFQALLASTTPSPDQNKTPSGPSVPDAPISSIPSIFVSNYAQGLTNTPPPPPPAAAPAPIAAPAKKKRHLDLFSSIFRFTLTVLNLPLRWLLSKLSFIKVEAIFYYLPPWFEEQRQYFVSPRVEAIVSRSLPNRDFDLLLIQVLTGFTIASLTEDAIGKVQYDIPKILEALTKMLIGTEELMNELHKTFNESHPQYWDKQAVIRTEVQPFFEEVESALKDVMVAFGDHLNVFRLPIPVARRLQWIAESL